MIVQLALYAALAANINEADAKGNTALLRAAATGSAADVERLLAQGADPNLGNALKLMPLHVAAPDARKVRALLAAKANPNAVSQQGRRPLHVAAAVAGALDSVKQLAAAGADLKALDKSGATALALAAGADDEAMVRYFVEQGVDVKAANRAGFTALHSAASNHNLAIVQLLLSKGADPNVANTLGGRVPKGEVALKGLTPLMLAAPYAPASVISALLDAGADVNAKDCRGLTPLMLAVASETQDASVVKLLLSRGAKAAERSLAGETAADWARKFNHPAVLKLLGATPSRLAASAATAQPAATPRQAVERSLALLQASAGKFFQEGGCLACHHSVTTAMAVGEARRHQIPVQEAGAQAFREGIVLGWQGPAAGLMQMIDPPGSVDSAIYALLGMRAAGVEPNPTSDALALYVARGQRAGGEWDLPGVSRAPIEEGAIHRTAFAIQVLQQYLPESLGAEKPERLARARKYLEGAAVRTTDDAVMRLAGLQWAGAQFGEIDRARKLLLALQRPDGGWAPNRRSASDAYATGTALYFLRETGTAVTAPAYRKGAAYLLSTQQADGSWHVLSRAPKFQPYFESGFPHGHDQWISNAGTAWATMALTGAVERTITAGLK